jgi:hypothetical protein
MNDSISKQSKGRMPSDEQMESLLKGFFRLEIPVELDQPIRPMLLTRARSEGGPRHGRRLSVVITASAMAMLVLMMVVIQGTAPGTFGTASAERPAAEPQNTVIDVSTQGSAGQRSAVVGEDGVTLEETDSIEVNALPD